MTRLATFLIQGSAAALALMLTAAPASAQAVCDGSDDSDAGGLVTNTVCGMGAKTTDGLASTAIGRLAEASGGTGNTAVGFTANANGNRAGRGDPNVDRVSNTAVGDNSQAFGDASINVALGTNSNATGNQSDNLALGAGANASGDSGGRIAVGAGSHAAGENSISLGYTSTANGQFSAALGNNSTADGVASVALGAGSIAGEDYVISVGNDTIKRQVVNVANGDIADGSSDAITGDQLFDTNQRVTALESGAGSALAAATAAQASADAAQDTADTAITNAATAQGTANTAITNAAGAQATADQALLQGDALGESTAAALGGGSTYDPVAGAISAPSYTIGTTNYNNVGAAFQAANTSGLQYFHTNSNAPDGAATGADSTAIGSALASGDRSIAFGFGAQATAEGAIAMGSASEASGVNAIAIGTGATATGSVAVGANASAANGGAAFGDRSTATGTDSAALGPDATATAANSVALGSGSVANEANVVSVGAAGAERRIVNVAAGTGPTDAVNVGQVQASAGSVASALGGGSTVSNAGLVSAPQYDVAGGSYNNVGSALGALSDFTYEVRREANAGIAAAMALGGTMIPADKSFSISFNLATYRGQQGFSGAAVARLNNNMWVSGGFAGSTVKGSTGGRVGVTFGW